MRGKLSLRKLTLVLAGTLALGLAAETAQARPGNGWRGGWGAGFDQDKADEVLREGKLLPLKRIVRQLEERVGGQLLDAELRAGGPGGKLYIIKWLTEDGRRVDFVVDASTGQILDSRGE
jgi:hypothetical protein